ncbi:CD80-like immunoglobulin C2-set [Trinorchestia longiramus]|nr:CD80-like immunoglobulin C2-set [Trinorchestia longiramus]
MPLKTWPVKIPDLWILLLLRLFVLCATEDEVEGENQRFATEPSDQTAVLGSMAVFPCRVINQVGFVQWTKDGFGLGVIRRLNGFDRYSMVGSDEEGDFSLSISPVTLEDDAEYQCQVSSATGKPLRSRVAKLTVFVPPGSPVIEQSPLVHTSAGSSVTLRCLSTGGRPAPEVQWLDDSGSEIHEGTLTVQELLEDGKRLSVESSLTITPTREHHFKSLSCVTHHPALPAALTASVRLMVEYPPAVHIRLNPPSILEGSEVRVSCDAEANPKDVSYRWFRGGQKIDVDSNQRSVNLGILSRSDHGTSVTCEATNAVGTTRQTTLLDVQYAPSFISAPSSESAEPNQNASLRCRVEGNPTPTIVWTYLRTAKMAGLGEELTVKAVESTTGSYMCTATSQGFAPLSATVHLRLRGPPVITSTAPVWSKLGEKAVLQCKVRAVPHPVALTWFKEGIAISADDDKYSVDEKQMADGVISRLVINTTQKEDFTSYNCTVVNEYGMDVGQIILLEQPSLSLVILFGFGACGAILIVSVIVFIICCRRREVKKKSSMSQESDLVKPCEHPIVIETHTLPVSPLTPKLVALDARSTDKDSDIKDGDMRTASSLSVGDRDSDAAFESDREPSPRIFPTIQMRECLQTPAKISDQQPITVPHSRLSTTSFIGPDEGYGSHGAIAPSSVMTANNNFDNGVYSKYLRPQLPHDPHNSLSYSIAPPPYTPPTYALQNATAPLNSQLHQTYSSRSDLSSQIRNHAPKANGNPSLPNGISGHFSNGTAKGPGPVHSDVYHRGRLPSSTSSNSTKFIVPCQPASTPGTLV